MWYFCIIWYFEWWYFDKFSNGMMARLDGGGCGGIRILGNMRSTGTDLQDGRNSDVSVSKRHRDSKI